MSANEEEFDGNMTQDEDEDDDDMTQNQEARQAFNSFVDMLIYQYSEQRQENENYIQGCVDDVDGEYEMGGIELVDKFKDHGADLPPSATIMKLFQIVYHNIYPKGVDENEYFNYLYVRCIEEAEYIYGFDMTKTQLDNYEEEYSTLSNALFGNKSPRELYVVYGEATLIAPTGYPSPFKNGTTGAVGGEQNSKKRKINSGGKLKKLLTKKSYGKSKRHKPKTIKKKNRKM